MPSTTTTKKRFYVTCLDEVATELIDYVETKLQATVRAVVATHFHDDCVGGLAAFHDRDIPSYGLAETLRRAQEEGNPVPKNAFNERLSLSVGTTEILTVHPGPGHTPDNVVAYVPADRVLFGGCLVKEMKATKGNLADADTMRWSATIAELANAFPRVRHVVPGHGNPGGPELLDYTRKLFAVR
ncbi:MAG: MBL fold metallo-hydrolase [Lewinella sp.]